MGDQDEFRCFIGNLSWSTSDRGLKQAFEKFGHLVEAKVRAQIFLCFCHSGSLIHLSWLIGIFLFPPFFLAFFILFYQISCFDGFPNDNQNPYQFCIYSELWLIGLYISICCCPCFIKVPNCSKVIMCLFDTTI